MRDFGKVPTQLWNRQGLSFYSKSLYAYLLSSPNANYFGCYLCKDGYIIADTGMTRASLRKGFEELEAAQLVERLGDFVYVGGILAQEKPRGGSVATSRMQEWRELGDDTAREKVAQGMLQCYDHLSDEQKAELHDFIYADHNDGTNPYIKSGINADIKPTINTDTNTGVNVGIKSTESREKRVESREDSLRSSSLRPSAPPVAAPPVALSPPKQEVLPNSQPNTTPVAAGEEPLPHWTTVSPQSKPSLQPQSKPESKPPPKPRPKREAPQRNLLLDAVVASTGGDIHATTPNAWSTAATALKQIRVATPEVTPELIAEKARIFRACHDFTLTPSSLAKWWGTLTAEAEQQAAAKLARTQPQPRRFGFAD